MTEETALKTISNQKRATKITNFQNLVRDIEIFTNKFWTTDLDTLILMFEKPEKVQKMFDLLFCCFNLLTDYYGDILKKDYPINLLLSE